jgi:hypothetical protein
MKGNSMLSSVTKVPGESILLIKLCKSVTEPNSQTEYYALANRLNKMLCQTNGSTTIVIDAAHVDVGSVERIMGLIDSLSGSRPIHMVLVLAKYTSGSMRAAVPVFSSVPRALDAARRAA